MRWRAWEEDRLRSFLLSRKKNLIVNLYKNILAGELRYRREDRFFIDMSQIVGRTPEQCKSKMQKFEKNAYTEFLKVPESHYDMFQWLRKKRSKKFGSSAKKRNGKSSKESKEEEYSKLRKRILEELNTAKISYSGKKGFLCIYTGFKKNIRKRLKIRY
jgi:hypothetical protein